MKRRASIYAYVLSALGIAIVGCCFYLYISEFPVSNAVEEWTDMIVLTGLLIICRSLPLYIDENSSIDMSFICMLAGLLIKGVPATIVMYAVSVPFTFEPDFKKTGRMPFTILNVPPIKTFFNLGNPVIAICLASIAYRLAGGSPGNVALPGCIGPLLAFVLVFVITNSGFLYLLFALNSQIKGISTIFMDFIQLFPSVLMAAPIGYFIAYLFGFPSGAYMAILFMCPLLLARHAFKQYLDGRKQYYSLIQTLSAAIEAKDHYTNGHSRRVELYACRIGQAMNLPEREVRLLGNAAVLHDIGKIGIKDEILNKPAQLTPDERDIIKTHPQIAINIIGESMIPPETREIILHHHERYDGAGYPAGSKGNENSLSAYILAAADAFDAITSNRPYQKGRTLEDAFKILVEGSGTQFHPHVVSAFLANKGAIQSIMEDSL